MTDAVSETPRRKPLGKKQIAWCRKWLKCGGWPVFADMESASKAARESGKGKPHGKG